MDFAPRPPASSARNAAPVQAQPLAYSPRTGSAAHAPAPAAEPAPARTPAAAPASAAKAPATAPARAPLSRIAVRQREGCTGPAAALLERRPPDTFKDRAALGLVKAMRLIADTFFQKRYGHRAVVLETVAAVPGMVGGMLQHFKALRHIRDDQGWIRELLDEAENERMHLMTFIEVAKPNVFERAVIVLAQLFFSLAYFLLYLFFPRTAHRFVAYLEEEAVVSYTSYLHAIDSGALPDGPAPEIAREYYKLPASATLRDVVVKVRQDEAHHRDVNHGFADRLASQEPGEDLPPVEIVQACAPPPSAHA